MSLMFEATGLLLTTQVTQATLPARYGARRPANPSRGPLWLPDLDRTSPTDAHGRYLLYGCPRGWRLIDDTQPGGYACQPALLV